ncbi:hypothetical protein DFH07DRAFT_766674 [Mycena maculata]|uniref:Uncharacterized protein n=1 Tax=Mycena maculata TaxID=230809 RepID=A0AAD7NVT1_9AGAR|nr:hypothetical protein DFH07DRAFT_766674 [Mycena maculata]
MATSHHLNTLQMHPSSVLTLIPADPATAAAPLPHRDVHFGPLPFTGAASVSHIPVPSPRPLGASPTPDKIDEGIKNLRHILNPLCGPNTRGYKNTDLNLVLRSRLELMVSFLHLYAAKGYTEWAKKADIVAKSARNGAWMSCRIREWVILFIKDPTNLPTAEYGKFNESTLEDEDLAQEIHLHLQTLGPFVSAQDVVNYMSWDEIKTQLNLAYLCEQPNGG